MCLVPIEWKGLKVITEISWWIDPAVQLSYFYIFAFHGTHRFESPRKEKAAARWRYDLGIHYNLFHCNVLYVNSSLFWNMGLVFVFHEYYFSRSNCFTAFDNHDWCNIFSPTFWLRHTVPWVVFLYKQSNYWSNWTFS